MADTTYQPKVYRKQGGDELVVASGGTITVESGGAISPASGSTTTISGTLALASGSTFTCAEPIDFSVAAPGTETTGSVITSGTTWITLATAGQCAMKLLVENTADTGEMATLRMRARANNTTVSGNGGNSVGTTTCIDASASAIDHEYGNLKAVNAVAQPNALNQTVDATNIVSALYGRVDRTGTSVGRTWVGWLDTHQTTKSDAGDYLLRLSHNGTVANDGAVTIYNGGRMPVLFNFEDAAGFLTDADDSLTTQSGSIAVKTPAGMKYIALYNHP